MQYQIELIIERIMLYETIYPEYFYAICVAIIGIFVIIIVGIDKAITAKQLSIVKETSPRYKALIELNSSFDFYENLKPAYYEYFRVNTKAKFDRFKFNSNMKTRISSNRDYYSRLLSQIKYNKDEYKNYLEKLNYLPIPTSEPEVRMSIHRYQKLEDKLYHSNLLHPTIDVYFYADLRYTSPKGRNSYHNSYRYMPHHIKGLMAEMKKEKDFKASKEYQRTLMTDSLRYDILKRDGFRCQICGRTAQDGAQLQVDHIKPIAKGGKTIASNLRALCDQCNLGKSDKWDAYGIN